MLNSKQGEVDRTVQLNPTRLTNFNSQTRGSKSYVAFLSVFYCQRQLHVGCVASFESVPVWAISSSIFIRALASIGPLPILTHALNTCCKCV